jgi:hypothetical protein
LHTLNEICLHKTQETHLHEYRHPHYRR